MRGYAILNRSSVYRPAVLPSVGELPYDRANLEFAAVILFFYESISKNHQFYQCQRSMKSQIAYFSQPCHASYRLRDHFCLSIWPFVKLKTTNSRRKRSHTKITQKYTQAAIIYLSYLPPPEVLSNANLPPAYPKGSQKPEVFSIHGYFHFATHFPLFRTLLRR